MQVIATAGHVDHGKSSLVRALTGMEPDRWAEERRRGLTIDLGFAWTALPGGEVVAFVDVPGHERFVVSMLAGAGPVPAVLFVVAADEGWMPQSSEHLAALDGFGVRSGLLVVTKADLADPAPVIAEARDRLAGTSLAGIAAVAVSSVDGRGLDVLRESLVSLASGVGDPSGDVRLWADRAFTIKGAGTVVTGTLGDGTLRVGDSLVTSTGTPVVVRGLQSLGEEVDRVVGTARVAVNLRRVEKLAVGRGTALLTPDAWRLTEVIDVQLLREVHDRSSRNLVLHVGSAAVAVRLRSLGSFARLTLASPLPLRVGDRGLVRDPSTRQIAGFVVLSVSPPPLDRRGAAVARGNELAEVVDDPVALGTALRLRSAGFINGAVLRAEGLKPDRPPRAGDWYADDLAWASTIDQARALTTSGPVTVETLRQSLPPDLIDPLLDAANLERVGALVYRADNVLTAATEAAVRALEAEWTESPFQAPSTERLTALALGPRELAAAARAGRLTSLPGNVILRADAIAQATSIITNLPEPLTVSAVREALNTTRRVAVPLLEHLDTQGITHRLPDGTRLRR
ncbi:selenocysteine-specific translation elongation factor [Kribbella sp. NPDC056861]|uniref:selenocysteine-specific translation elongation factor n=1 Tax=Kribbella sp. NPDC056861 TaxID=3154857 RepID=UPI0034445530